MASTETKLQPWWREPTRPQWAAFLAAYFAWVLDSFDFNVYVVAVTDIKKEFAVSNTAATGLITLTLLTRLLGGIIAGTLGDKYGRKLPLMISIVWIAVCDGLIAIAPNFETVTVLRAAFGLGMGAVWACSATLAMENWPARSRGIASGILQGGWAVGYLLSALLASSISDQFGWRAVFIVAAIPGLIVIPIHKYVPESKPAAASPGASPAISWGAMLRNRAIVTTLIWGALVMGFGFAEYYAFTASYAQMAKALVGSYASYVTLFSLGMLVGAPFFGWMSGRYSPKAAINTAAIGALIFAPLYLGLWPSQPSTIVFGIGAVMVGACGGGMAGVTPALLASTFPAEIRTRALGTVYNVGAAFAAIVPLLIAWLADAKGFTLGQAMAACASAALVTMMLVMLMRPKPLEN
jgi:MFS transporter, SHS family, lactate transporter